jgi:glycosyltransferase involved in cell wall biosynthesis
LKIIGLETFNDISHKSWWNGIKKYSQHEWESLALSAHHWKWRMHGGAVTLAQQYLKQNLSAELIWASDFVFLPVFQQVLMAQGVSVPPVILYFHENQLSYPWSPNDPDVSLKRDLHYCYMNWVSALSAVKVLFNSQYHYDSFFDSLLKFLHKFPDHLEKETVQLIKDKSEVLSLGMGLLTVDKRLKESKVPTLLWNHRWEYDKNPEDFFQSLFEISDKGVPFQLVVTGHEKSQSPTIFSQAKEKLNQHIIHWGFCENKEEYHKLLLACDILPVTGIQDFFGISVVEAISAGVVPLLPNRLAYGEHIPQSHHFQLIYQNEADYMEKLLKLLDQSPSNDLRQELSTYVGKYDWKLMIKKYDSLSRSCV